MVTRCCRALYIRGSVHQRLRALYIRGSELCTSEAPACEDKESERHLIQRALVKRTLLQRRSGMARIVEGFRSFTCHPLVYPRMEWTMYASAFAAEAGSHLQPRRNERLSCLDTTTASNSLPKNATWRISQLLAVQTATHYGGMDVELTTPRTMSRDAKHWAIESPNVSFRCEYIFKMVSGFLLWPVDKKVKTD